MNLVVSNLFPLQAVAQQGVASGQSVGNVLQGFSANQIEVSEDGTRLQLAWPEISGATDIALERASVSFYPPANSGSGRSLGHLRGSFSGDRCNVNVPEGPRPIRSLYLSGLRLTDEDETPLPDRGALIDQGLRLAVAMEVGGVLAPVSLAVPRIEGNPSSPPFTTPPLLDGATYGSYRLTLPDVSASVLWLMVVSGSDPDDFTPTAFALDHVSAQAEPSPVDLSLLDADGAPFFTGSGPVTATMTIDARNAVGRALDAALAAQTQPLVELTVTSRVPGRIGTFGILAAGEVQRVFDDKIAVTLDGAPVTPDLPGAPLDAQVPSSASSDMVIDHAGLRLHEISDPLPSATGGEAGPVVSMTATVWRALPLMALRGEVLRRVGVVGYGLEAATLSLRVLGAGPDGSAIAPPTLATAQCEIAAPDLRQAQSPRVHWFDLGEGVTVDGPIGFEVSAVSGRFLWIAQADRPVVRLAVAHALAGGETVEIGGEAFALTGPRTELNGVTIAGHVFATPPVIESTQFATVTLSRLTLGYAP